MEYRYRSGFIQDARKMEQLKREFYVHPGVTLEQWERSLPSAAVTTVEGYRAYLAVLLPSLRKVMDFYFDEIFRCVRCHTVRAWI